MPRQRNMAISAISDLAGRSVAKHRGTYPAYGMLITRYVEA
jgi:hypothetical protein